MLSRNAASHPGASSLVQELEVLGCKTFVRSCDVANASSLAEVLQQCQEHGMPPIRGVVQAAMALHVRMIFITTRLMASNNLLGFDFRTHVL